MTSHSAFSGHPRVPRPVNEPAHAFAPGSVERAALKARLTAMARERVEIPLVIGGRDITSGDTAPSVMPHDHAHVLADSHRASADHVRQAIRAAHEAHRDWSTWSF
jgi:1-pyrroline-5-carboxylate dehydrogenase